MPSYIDQFFTTLNGYGADILSALFTLGVLVFGGFWLLSLVRRGANAAKPPREF